MKIFALIAQRKKIMTGMMKIRWCKTMLLKNGKISRNKKKEVKMVAIVIKMIESKMNKKIAMKLMMEIKK